MIFLVLGWFREGMDFGSAEAARPGRGGRAWGERRKEATESRVDSSRGQAADTGGWYRAGRRGPGSRKEWLFGR
jgi:hypothetical protein